MSIISTERREETDEGISFQCINPCVFPLSGCDVYLLYLLGDQPEWRPETEDLCGPGPLPKHQHSVPGGFISDCYGYNTK